MNGKQREKVEDAAELVRVNTTKGQSENVLQHNLPRCLLLPPMTPQISYILTISR